MLLNPIEAYSRGGGYWTELVWLAKIAGLVIVYNSSVGLVDL